MCARVCLSVCVCARVRASETGGSGHRYSDVCVPDIYKVSPATTWLVPEETMRQLSPRVQMKCLCDELLKSGYLLK